MGPEDRKLIMSFKNTPKNVRVIPSSCIYSSRAWSLANSVLQKLTISVFFIIKLCCNILIFNAALKLVLFIEDQAFRNLTNRGTFTPDVLSILDSNPARNVVILSYGVDNEDIINCGRFFVPIAAPTNIPEFGELVSKHAASFLSDTFQSTNFS